MKDIALELLLGAAYGGTSGGGGGGGSEVARLSQDMTVSYGMGGISAGRKYTKGTSLETVFRELLSPTLYPTITEPSARLTTSDSLLVDGSESVVSRTVSFSYDRGRISPAYGTSGYRSGAAHAYSATTDGTEGTPFTQSTQTITVTEEKNVVQGYVWAYEGEQPKDSSGKNYQTNWSGNPVLTNTLTFEFVLPLWSNAANNAVIAKEQLMSKSVGMKVFDFGIQYEDSPNTFDVPASWNVTAVEILNTLSGQWVDYRAGFDVSDVRHGSKLYKRYAGNERVKSGERSHRVKWTV